MKRLLEALAFLTILPLPPQTKAPRPQALAMFPVAGLVVGAVVAIFTQLAALFVPQQVTAALAVCLLAALSGALHLDGLADTCDGFGSCRPREKILAIMRDSRIGVMGSVALLLVLLLKVHALAAMDQKLQTTSLLLMPLFGRAAIVWQMRFLPYARREDGAGQLFYQGLARSALFMAMVLPAAALTLAAWKHFLPVAAGVVIVNLLLVRLCRKKINGATGDTLGAASELTETMVAVAMTAALPL